MKKFTLAPYVRLGFLDGTLHFGFGSLRQLITDKAIQNCIIDAAIYLKTPRSIDEVSSFLKNTGITQRLSRALWIFYAKISSYRKVRIIEKIGTADLFCFTHCLVQKLKKFRKTYLIKQLPLLVVEE